MLHVDKVAVGAYDIGYDHLEDFEWQAQQYGLRGVLLGSDIFSLCHHNSKVVLPMGLHPSCSWIAVFNYDVLCGLFLFLGDP